MTAQYTAITHQRIVEIINTHQTSQGEYYEIILKTPFIPAFMLLRECGGFFVATNSRTYCPATRWDEYDGELRMLEAAMDARDDGAEADHVLLYDELIVLSGGD